MGGGTNTNYHHHGINMFDAHHLYVASVVATYWFVSISMVYLNKVLMSNEGISIPAPLFVTWFQCIATAVICWFAGVLGQKLSPKNKSEFESLTPKQSAGVDEEQGSASAQQQPQQQLQQQDAPPEKNFWSQFPKAEYKIGTGQRVFPLSLIFVGMITFNNLCLRWVEVSFYNVARSLTIVFNVVFSATMLHQSTSNRTMVCLVIVILGFFLGSKGELNFSMRGTIAGVTSSLFVSLNSIYTKKVLPVVDNDHWRLTFYNNVNASLLFIPLIVVFEHQPIYAALGNQFLSSIFWTAMLIAGFFGFSIGIVTVLQIKATSPLTHNISGTAKAAVQSMLAFYIWKNQPTFMGVLGIFVVLGGSLLYTYVKMQENAAAAGRKMGSSVVSSSASSASSSSASSSSSAKDIIPSKDTELQKVSN